LWRKQQQQQQQQQYSGRFEAMEQHQRIQGMEIFKSEF